MCYQKRPNHGSDILSWVLNEKELPMQYLSEELFKEKKYVSKSQEEATVI